MEVGSVNANLESVKHVEKQSREMFQNGADLKKVKSGQPIPTNEENAKVEKPAVEKESTLKSEGKGVLDLLA